MWGQCDGCEQPGEIGPDGLCTWHRAEVRRHPDEWQEYDEVPSDVVGRL